MNLTLESNRSFQPEFENTALEVFDPELADQEWKESWSHDRFPSGPPGIANLPCAHAEHPCVPLGRQIRPTGRPVGLEGPQRLFTSRRVLCLRQKQRAASMCAGCKTH
jgi:hypothetical protein